MKKMDFPPAATKGHDQVAVALAKDGTHGDGRHPLMHVLLNAGADVSVRHRRGGMTALHHAALNGNDQMASLLIAHHAEMNLKDGEGATPLHHAARHGHVKVTQVLIDQGAELNARDNRGFTPLDISLSNQYKKLLAAGADVSTRNAFVRSIFARKALPQKVGKKFSREPESIRAASWAWPCEAKEVTVRSTAAIKHRASRPGVLQAALIRYSFIFFWFRRLIHFRLRPRNKLHMCLTFLFTFFP